ncbi:hypothetical protein [Mycobacteroides salmoniphilum]|uniref:hypothetical protein n=1 Tax=Mycobacteroides salmoniphilum TaxID=404941 RepID=UPI0014312227|nr:hypothetical protein [Mycobacteroides salmoniphilum]
MTRSAETFGGVSPNAYIPRVTVDLRVFYPPNRESYLLAISELANAYDEARGQLTALIKGAND